MHGFRSLRSDESTPRPPAPLRGFLVALIAACVSLIPRSADAGCGCDKPPPPPAQVRPNVTWAGTPVMLFASSLVEGTPYTVTFTSGVTGEQQSVDTQVVVRRDLADGTQKPQIVVSVPMLPLGPASIRAQRTGQAVVDVVIDDSQFTVAPQPLGLPTSYGAWQYPGYQGAVGRDGVVYISLDLTGLQKPMVFEAQATGYPMRFAAQDVLFKNIQGFLMQLLVQGSPDAQEPVPGMFIFPAQNPAADSDILHYSRHEFSTYFLQHAERQPHAVDPTDGNWHMDGSRHVDHDHLILAIMAHNADRSLPAPGATPPFTLLMKSYSLFYQGLVGKSSVTMKSMSQTDSFGTGAFDGGDVMSNGQVRLDDFAVVNGDAVGTSFRVASTARISGQRVSLPYAQTFMDVKLPPGLPTLGSIDTTSDGSISGSLLSIPGSLTTSIAGSRTVYTIAGPGSFQVDDLKLGSTTLLYVDNSRGPVTLYVTGVFLMRERAEIRVANADPEQFAVYVTGNMPVTLAGNTYFFGVVYAPQSSVEIKGATDFFGAFVGNTLTTTGLARVHYYRPLRGK
jgi:hypothetical protein